jgi:hypothetical protein
MIKYLLQALHNCVAHPLLGLLGYPAPEWAIRFHDWTAELAWEGHLKGVDENPERLDIPYSSDTTSEKLSYDPVDDQYLLEGIKHCPRCKGAHAFLTVIPFAIPAGKFDCWGTCPSTGDPILLQVEDPFRVHPVHWTAEAPEVQIPVWEYQVVPLTTSTFSVPAQKIDEETA